MGTGTRDMIAECRAAGLPGPEFRLTDGFVATIWRPVQDLALNQNQTVRKTLPGDERLKLTDPVIDPVTDPVDRLILLFEIRRGIALHPPEKTWTETPSDFQRKLPSPCSRKRLD